MPSGRVGARAGELVRSPVATSRAPGRVAVEPARGTGRGGVDPGRGRAGAVRRREQARAAAALGVTEVRYLGYPDGRVDASLGLRRDLTRSIRELRPSRVLAPTPVWNLASLAACRPDHLAAGAAVAFAVHPDATTPAAHPELLAEGLLPWHVQELWFVSDAQPNRAVDVTDTFETELHGVLAHETRVAASDLSTEAPRDWAAEAGRRWRLAPGRLAEELRVGAVS